jgi:hypothetical protein
VDSSDGYLYCFGPPTTPSTPPSQKTEEPSSTPNTVEETENRGFRVWDNPLIVALMTAASIITIYKFLRRIYRK